MRKIILLVLFETMWTTGFSQTLSFKFGTPFRQADLDIRWNAPSNALPNHVWVYHLLPNRFSASAVNYLTSLGPFSEMDMVRSNGNDMLFVKPDRVTSLWVSFRLGAVEYYVKNHFGPTNLAENVPAMARLPELTTNFLRQVGISVSEIEKRPDGTPDFNFWEPFTEYFINRKFVTNIEFRAVSFCRAVDGTELVGNGAGGDGQVQFGEYGKPSQIRLSWRNVERYKAYPTVAPKALVKWIQQGKAVQNMVPMDFGDIDWKNVKSLTVSQAKICYYAGDSFNPTDWLMPFAALWTTVDTGRGKIEIEVDCPVVESSKTPERSK